jgi:hypothetical protein
MYIFYMSIITVQSLEKVSLTQSIESVSSKMLKNDKAQLHVHVIFSRTVGVVKGIGSILFLKNGLKKFCRKKLYKSSQKK